MRNAFVAKLTEIARENEKIVLLVGDIGFGVFENFKKEFPKRYFNLGIAEQNSIDINHTVTLTVSLGYFTLLIHQVSEGLKQLRVLARP